MSIISSDIECIITGMALYSTPVANIGFHILVVTFYFLFVAFISVFYFSTNIHVDMCQNSTSVATDVATN